MGRVRKKFVQARCRDCFVEFAMRAYNRWGGATCPFCGGCSLEVMEDEYWN